MSLGHYRTAQSSWRRGFLWGGPRIHAELLKLGFDGGLQGLYLVVQPSGAKSWAHRYRLNGKTKKCTIGAFPKVDLVNARKLARDAVTPVGEGCDPRR
jgi:hypothetical protein